MSDEELTRARILTLLDQIEALLSEVRSQFIPAMREEEAS